jgi:predicted nucleotidyltransferase
MNTSALAIAQELKARLSSAVTLVDVRLFGSCARGACSDDSDIDVFVEIETLTREAKRLVRDIAWEVGLEHEAVISPLVFSRDEIENSPLRASPIVENIFRDSLKL